MWAPGSGWGFSRAERNGSESGCEPTIPSATAISRSISCRPSSSIRKERASMPEAAMFARRSAFAGLLQPGNSSGAAGVIVTECPNLQIATIIVRRGREALAEKVRGSYGLELLAGPKRIGKERLAFVGTGPRNWLALREDGPLLADELQNNL